MELVSLYGFIHVYIYYFIRRDSQTQLGFLWISPFWTNQDDGFIPAEALLRILRAAKHSLAVSSREGSEGYDLVCSVRQSSKMFKRLLNFGVFNSLIVFLKCLSIYPLIFFYIQMYISWFGTHDFAATAKVIDPLLLHLGENGWKHQVGYPNLIKVDQTTVLVPLFCLS